MKKALWGFLAVLGSLVYGDPFATDNLFGEMESVVVEMPISETSLTEDTAGVSFSPSGSLTSQLFHGVNRDYFKAKNWQDISQRHQSVGELLLDVRTGDDSKAFAALEGVYRADNQLTSGYVRELFVDFHLKRRLYVRAGKQVLQWGRGHFWHPSDLINVEQKDLIERAGAREGTNGLRLHAPFGAKTNFYAFFDNRGGDSLQDLRSSFKAEFILGPVETAFSLWKKSALHPAYAWDASTRLGNWDFTAEAVFLPKNFVKNWEIAPQKQGLDSLYAKASATGAPRVAISAGRSFRFLEVPDRLRLQYEFYYNSLGNHGKDYKSAQIYAYSSPTSINMGTNQDVVLNQGTISMWLASQGQIQAYSLGKYYAAGFLSIDKFLLSDMTLALNGVVNLSDQSYVFTGSLSYRTMHNLSLQAAILAFGGKPQGEFTISGQKIQSQLSAGISF